MSPPDDKDPSKDLKDLLRAPAVARRLEGVERAEADGRADDLLPLLADDAPFVFERGGVTRVGEVRFWTLDALQGLYRAAKRAPDFGPVTVRRAPSADEVRSQAWAALSGLDTVSSAGASSAGASRTEALAAVDLFLDTRVLPAESERALLRDYRLLQHLGLLDYRLEEVDPATWLTPLQAEVAASQLVSARPLPHLQLSQGGRTLGYIYREGGRWALDFSEDHDARRAARRATQVLTGIDRRGVPRVLFSADGAPQRSADGALVLDGVVPLDGPPVEVLRSLAAFAGRWCDAALKEP